MSTRKKAATSRNWEALLQRADGHQSVIVVTGVDEAEALAVAEEIARPTHVTLSVTPTNRTA